MRNQITAALKESMKAQDATRTATLRLIAAAIKDQEIARRSSDDAAEIGDPEILQILGKMIKQREESAKLYEEGGRLELAERERAEMDVIRHFLPKQLSADEVQAAISAAITATKAGSIRDMGKVMGSLKSQYAGQMDFGKVGPQVKEALCAGG